MVQLRARPEQRPVCRAVLVPQPDLTSPGRSQLFKTIPEFPFQEGSSLTAGGINYNSLEAMKAMNMLEELSERLPVGR